MAQVIECLPNKHKALPEFKPSELKKKNQAHAHLKIKQQNK
jgi:hypothetical protein